MNPRAIVTLGVLLGAAYGKSPEVMLRELHQQFRKAQAAEPANMTVKVVLLGAVAFYLAERGRNPKILSYYDALVYVSTNLSVGYSDILARTPLGKALGSLLMAYGPALAARTLDAPSEHSNPSERLGDVAALAEKLDLILAELVLSRRLRADDGSVA